MIFSPEKKDKITRITGLLLLGLGVGFLFGHFTDPVKTVVYAGLPQIIRQNNNQYHYINPFLALDSDQAPELADLQKQFQDYAKASTVNHDADQVSVYFRLLGLGRWVGVNENDSYTPASLLKVPVMMTYLNLAVSDPSVLQKTLVYTGKTDLNTQETIKPQQALVAGQSYTVDDLISRMIKGSDNNALDLLYNNLDPKSFDKIFTDFGVLIPPVNPTQQDFISPRTYSLFFRVLFGATYLDRNMSEKAIELMINTEFKDGLVAGVPGNITVAHKFGQYGVSNNPNSLKNELHDCGIIYYPGQPYLLCVMTKGANFQNLENVIAQISRTAYDYMAEHYH